MIHYLSQLRKLFSPSEKRKFLVIAILMGLSGIMETASIGLLTGVVALFISPDTPAAQKVFEIFFRFFPGADRNIFIVCALSSAAMLLVLKNLFALLIVHIQSKFLRSNQAILTSRLFNSLLNADYRYFITRSADEYNGLIERINRLFDCFLQPAIQILADSLVIACLSLVSLCILPWGAIIMLIIMLFAAWAINRLFHNVNNKLSQERYHIELAENKLRLNVLLGMEQIKISCAEEKFSKKFNESSKKICRRYATLYTLGQLPRLSLETIALILVCSVFIILVYSGMSTDQIILTFTVIIAAMARILPALSRVHYNLTNLRQNSVFLDELSENLHTIPRESAPESTEKPDSRNDIILENVNFGYTPDKLILQNFNQRIPARQITGISGRSGCGKTTLINLLAGLFLPAGGKILAGDTEISANLPHWRRQIGYVPQNVFVFDGTLRENIALGCDPDRIDDEKICAVLKAAQLPEFANTPNMLLNSRSGLSGGQRQRIGIARALYRDPQLLILDEATSALDTTTENAFLKVLQDLRGKITIIVISHRPDTLAICDKEISF